MVVPHQHCPPFQCVYHFVNLYLCRLCIPNIVHDFCAMPQIMFMNMWVSISGFNDEHLFRSKFILSVVVKEKSCMCWGSQGKSSLWTFFNSGVESIFRFSFIFGDIFIFWVVFIFFWLSYFLVLLHFWAVLIFGVIFFLLIFIFWGIFIFEVVFFLVVFILVSFQIFGHLHFWGWANYPLLVPSVALTLSLDLCA